MFQKIKEYSERYVGLFDSISTGRKQIHIGIAEYISERHVQNKAIDLCFICTHNSRRSVLAQLWAKVAANYYGIKNLSTCSGGTEVTSIHPNIIATLERHGFEIKSTGQSSNPRYEVIFENGNTPDVCFSKMFDDQSNPKADFAAIMVCESGAQNCPYVPGAEKRIVLSFEDPKSSDGTAEEAGTYDAACDAIAVEMFHIFYLVKQKL